MRKIFLPFALILFIGLTMVNCGPSKADQERIAKADSILKADSIAKAEAEAEAARIEKEKQDSIEKARQDSIAKKEERRKAGIMMTFTIPREGTCTLYSSGKIKCGKNQIGSWKRAYGVIQVFVDFPAMEGEIYEGFIIGDRFYYDFFGSEGASDMYYNAAAGTVTWGVEQETKKLSQCSSVKVIKED